MALIDGALPLLMLFLLTVFAAGVAVDHDGERRRAAGAAPGEERGG